MANPLEEWVEARTGLVSALGRAADVTLHGGPRWRHAVGAALLALLAVLGVTGVALMTVYAPGVHTAWSSVFYLQDMLPWGRTVRGMHYFAAHGLVAMTALHLGVTALAAAHRRPRELTWWLGLALGGVMLAFFVTGIPLVWDQRGYWSSRVETGIVGSLPLVGPWAQRLVMGGGQYGAITLTRFYTLHVTVLPAIVTGLLLAHLALVRKHGLGTPDAARPAVRYGAAQAGRDLALSLVTVCAVAWAGWRWGAPLDAPADASSQYTAVPQWMFMPLSQLLKLVGARGQFVGAVVVPGLLGGYLVALPFLDTQPRPLRRALALVPLAAAALVALGLGMQLRASTRTPAFLARGREAAQRATRARALAREGIPPEGPLEMVRNDPTVRPRELFTQHCVPCHGGRGGPGEARAPALEGFGSRRWAMAFLVWPDAPHFMGPTEIHDMPPQGRRLREEGLRAVSEWLHSRGQEPGDPPVDAALVAQGEAIFRRRCTVCHQGEGDQSESPAEERDAPNLDEWGSRAYIRYQLTHPGAVENYGRRNHMPRFDDRLGAREMVMVIDYVRALRQHPAPAVVEPPAE